MTTASDIERLMLDLINEERARYGLDPVVLDLRLNASAETHSEWMLAEDVFSHTGEGGSSAGERMDDADFDFSGSWGWGENIAYQSLRGPEGLEDDVRDLHAALMASPGHRANILNPDFEAIGIGLEVGEFNGAEVLIVTQNFAYTDAALLPDEGQPDPPPPQPVIEGGSGADRLMGTEFKDTIKGYGGDDLIKGFAGADKLIGAGGDDRLYGGAARDILNGGAGDDLLVGGGGNDSFQIKALNDGERDVIRDFRDGSDTIVIGGLDGSDAARFAQVDVLDDGADTRLMVAGHEIVLEGVDHRLIDHSDFDFI